MVQNSAYLQQQTDSKDTLLFDVEYLRKETVQDIDTVTMEY